MCARPTRKDPRLAPTPRDVTKIIEAELRARNDPTLTAIARPALLVRRTVKPASGKRRGLLTGPGYEGADIELVLRVARWQRLWAYLAKESVPPLGDFYPKETTLEFIVSWKIGLPHGKERQRASRPPSQIDDRLGRATRFVLAVGRDAIDYERRKREFQKHIDAAFREAERKAMEAMRRAGRVRLHKQPELLAAHLMYERLRKEGASSVYATIARTLWPTAYEALREFDSHAHNLRRAIAEAKRERLLVPINSCERRAKRCVSDARKLVLGGWRRFFIAVPTSKRRTKSAR